MFGFAKKTLLINVTFFRDDILSFFFMIGAIFLLLSELTLTLIASILFCFLLKTCFPLAYIDTIEYPVYNEMTPPNINSIEELARKTGQTFF